MAIEWPLSFPPPRSAGIDPDELGFCDERPLRARSGRSGKDAHSHGGHSTAWMSPLKVLRCGHTQPGHGAMPRREFIATIAGITALPVAALAQAVPPIAPQNGAALYSQYCSQCHDAANSRAPGRSVLQSMKLEEVLRALGTGSMASIAQERSEAERTAIASFITGKGAEAPPGSTDISGSQCRRRSVRARPRQRENINAGAASLMWQPGRCSPALSAAVTAIPGVVFSGGVSGYLRAYATGDARLLWEVDTARDYATMNGVSARGGAMDGPGPTIVDGMLYVNSGYEQWGGLPGPVGLRSQESLKTVSWSAMA